MADGIDAKDRALIEALREDARRSYAELGTLVGLSADAVRTRVERLTAEDVVRIVTLIDPALVGRSVRVSVGVETTGDPDLFASWARAQSDIVHLVRTVGSVSFFAEVISPTLHDAHRFVTERLSLAPGVRRTEVWPVLEILKWREDTRAPVVERDVLRRLALTEDDRMLLRELITSPRVQFRELADRLSRPYGVVRRRALALLDAGVVRPTVITNDIITDEVQLAVFLARGDERARDVLVASPAVTIVTAIGGDRQYVGEISAPTTAELVTAVHALQDPSAGVFELEVLLYVSVDKLPASLGI